MPDTWFYNWGLPVLVVLLWFAAVGLSAWLAISVAERGVQSRRSAGPSGEAVVNHDDKVTKG